MLNVEMLLFDMFIAKPRDVQPANLVPKNYFNKITGRCVKFFIYGGNPFESCCGNENIHNQFDTKEECEITCPCQGKIN